MAATPPSQSNPAGDDRHLVAVDETTAATFEDKLHLFWQKNRNAVFAVVGLVLLAIAGKEGWDYLQRQKQLDIEKAYAAATTPEQLKAFAAAHRDHALAGVSHLRMADDAYKAGKSADAIAGYDQAIAILKKGPLAARAQLGRALAKAQAGKPADATADLKQLADDKNQFKAIRAEAAYHLTSLAVEAANATDAQKYSDQLMQIDPASPWTQRALALRASLPASAEKPAATTATEKAGDKKDEAAAPVKLNIPGKK
jgi:hypothetical protein